MRCRTLARELQCRGASVIFLCRRQPGDLINLLEREFAVLALPEQILIDCDGLEGRDLYQSWLGCSQDQDASQCFEVLAQAGIKLASWIVVDHYGLDARWEAQLLDRLSGSDSSPKLLVIDDLADRTHKADLLLDQNFFGDFINQRYQALVPSTCRLFLGPHYALLGKEYAQLHPLIPPRKELKRLLVFFGGVDQANLTGRVLEALMDPAFADLAVDVVLGLQCPHRHSVEELVARRPNTTLHGPLLSLAGLIARADLAIGAGGSTTWERSCLRLQSLVVVIAANQRSFSEALDQAGHLHLLGDETSVTADQIRSALLSLMIEPKSLKVATALTDGWGASRLATAMLGPQGLISLRPALVTDEELVLRWVNDPQVSISIFSTLKTVPENYECWLQNCLTSPNCLWLIATDSGGSPIGQIRFDRKTSSAQSYGTDAEVHLSLDRCACGNGLAADLVRLGLQEMEQRWGPTSDAVAVDRNTTTAQNACFARSVFVADSEFFSDSAPPDSEIESHALEPSCVTLLSDCGSWLNAYLPDLIFALWQRGHAVRWIHSPEALCPGEVCLLLSCGRLLSAEQLALHRYNLVVHESSLPKGQGWSPMTWQILEGSNSIPITLFEAVADLDTGPIHLQQQITLQGHELVDEWRALQAHATHELCLTWFDRYQLVIKSIQPQHGESSFYPRRGPSDSEINPELPLSEQYNLLRVVDNKRYPAFFQWRGRKYTINLEC